MKTPKRLQLVAFGEPSDVIEPNTVSEPALGQEDVLVSMEAMNIHRSVMASEIALAKILGHHYGDGAVYVPRVSFLLCGRHREPGSRPAQRTRDRGTSRRLVRAIGHRLVRRRDLRRRLTVRSETRNQRGEVV
jgi:hypothetical protein